VGRLQRCDLLTPVIWQVRLARPELIPERFWGKDDSLFPRMFPNKNTKSTSVTKVLFRT